MKKSKSLIESQGMVDKDGIQWNDLADLLTEYIYDLHYGLNADPFYDGNEADINRGTIESYYQYKNSKKMPDYIIPKWVGSFNVHLINSKTTNGTFLLKAAKLNDDNKLSFTIEARNSMDSPNNLCNTFVHELLHAYSTWIQLTKNIRFHNNRSTRMYYHSTKAFDDVKYGGAKHPMVLLKFADFLEINDEIFENPLYLERTLLAGFYYSDVDEIRSFTLEFANDIMHKIKDNFDNIRKEIKQSLEFKNDFNSIAKVDLIKSNVLNNLSITCYDSKYYKTYKSYYTFYKKLEKMNIDEDIAYKAIKGSSHAIRICLNIPVNKKLIEFDGDGNKILKLVAQKQLIIYENAIKKMNKIFAKIISEIPVK